MELIKSCFDEIETSPVAILYLIYQNLGKWNSTFDSEFVNVKNAISVTNTFEMSVPFHERDCVKRTILIVKIHATTRIM